MTHLIPIKKSLQENATTKGINGEIFSIPEVGLAVHDGVTEGGVLLQPRADGAGYNLLRNGNFIVDQNGNSWQNIPSSGSIEYIADGWFYHRGGGSTANAGTAVSIANGLPSAYKALRITTFTGGLSNSFSILSQQISGANLLDGKTVTVSFWAKTPQSRRIAIVLRRNYDSASGVYEEFLSNVQLTNDWKFYSFTSQIPKSDPNFVYGPNNSTGLWIWLEAGNDWDNRTGGIGAQSGQTDIANVKMEVGPIATPFEASSYADELLKVQRYYEKSFRDIFMSRGGYGDASTVNVSAYAPFAVKKALIPTVTVGTNFLTSPTVHEIGVNGFNVLGTANDPSSIARITEYVADCEITPY